jgi:molecular chaperone GrpE
MFDNATFAHNFAVTMKKKDLNDNQQNREQDVTNNVNIASEEQTAGETGQQEGPKESSEVEKLKAQVEELNDRYLRQAAEFDNFRRRNAKERIELIQTAGKDVITDLLDVLDDSERAQKQLDATDDIQQIKEGVQLVFIKLRNLLTAKGLKPMDAVNKEFNPDLHEAITEIDAGDEMKGKVVAEVQKGYYLNDKIIRFAKVVVGK